MSFQKHCPGCFHDKSGVALCPVCGYDESASRSALFLPHGIIIGGQYRVGRVLGQPGGFGITYLGWDVHLQQRVAIKEFLPRDIVTRHPGELDVFTHTEYSRSSFEFGKDQFLREARIVAKLDHPNVVRVRSFFNANGTAYLVMDYYDGLSLGDYLARVRQIIEPALAVPLIRPVLDALQYVHEHGVVHRDLKPHNIYLASIGKPIVLDFGAARQAAGERVQSLSVVLTDGYAPLEQYQRRSTQGPWTDVYGAAATLFRMLTGAAPPTALDRLSDDPLQHDAAWGATPAALRPALMRALALMPEARFQSINDFIAALSDFRPQMTAAASLPMPAMPASGPPIQSADEPTARTAPTLESRTREPALSASEMRSDSASDPTLSQSTDLASSPTPDTASGPTPDPSSDPSFDAIAPADELPAAEEPQPPARREFPLLPPSAPEALSPLSPLSPPPSATAGADTMPGSVASRSSAPPTSPTTARSAASWTVLALPVVLILGPLMLIAGIAWRWTTPSKVGLATVAVTNTASVPYSAVASPSPAPASDGLAETPLTAPLLQPRMLLLPAAIARIGDDAGDAGERPAHSRRIGSFAISADEISVEQFAQFVSATGYANPQWTRYVCEGPGGRDRSWEQPGFAQSPQRPVVCVSAVDASAYAQWLSRHTGLRFRLPTEAEWEYAARGGSSSRFWWGAAYDPAKATCSGCPQARSGPSPVSSWPRNPFGLADTAGNVREWTCSAFAPYGASASVSPGGDAAGSDATDNVSVGEDARCANEYADRWAVRGGSWVDGADELRSARRSGLERDRRDVATGFRLAQDVAP